MSRRLKLAVGILISAALLWWVLHDVSLPEVWRRLGEADPLLLLAMVVVATLGYVLRAMRWRVLLLPAYPDTSFHGRWAAVCIGFMANNVLPARLGEFARAYSLSRVESLSMSGAFASLIVERVFDGLVIAFFLFVAVAVPGFLGGGATTGSTVRNLAMGGAAVFGGALVVLWLVVRHPDVSVRIFERTLGRLLPSELGERAADTLARFIEGLGALHDPGVFWRALVWSLALWLWLAASIWLGLLAFDIREPGITGALLVQSVIAFAVALPSSPGFFGTLEAGARIALSVYAVDTASIISFALGYHILTFIPVTLLGLWYVNRLGLRWSEVEHSEELVEEATGGEGAFPAGASDRPGGSG